MKRQIWLLLIVFLGACSNGGDHELYTLKIGDSVTTGPINITFTNVHDSRCPKDPLILCIWEGEAEVELVLQQSDLMSTIYLVERGLCNRPCGTSDTTWNKIFTLLEVNPYPSDTIMDISLEDYEIKLRIEDYDE